MEDSNRSLTGTANGVAWSQPSLWEVLDDETHQAVPHVSPSQRRRGWDREHNALDLICRQQQRDEAIRAFRLATARARLLALDDLG